LIETLTWAMAASGSLPVGLLFIVREHPADRFDRLVDPLRDLAVGGFQPARAGRRVIKLAGEPRPIGAERMDLHQQRLEVTIEFAAPPGCGFERIKRKRQTPARDGDGIGIVHVAIRYGQRVARHQVKTLRPQLFTHGSLRRIEQERQRPKQISSHPVHDAVARGPRI